MRLENAVGVLQPVAQSGKVGRPKCESSEEVLLQFRSLGFTWAQIAQMLLVSRWTIFPILYRHCKKVTLANFCAKMVKNGILGFVDVDNDCCR